MVYLCILFGKHLLENLKCWSCSLIEHLLNPTICKPLMIKDGKEILLRNWHLSDEEGHRGTYTAICANCKDFPGGADRTGRAVVHPPGLCVGTLKRSLSWATKDKSDTTRIWRKEEEEKPGEGPGVWGSPCPWISVSFHLCCSLVCAQSCIALWLSLIWGSCLLSGFSLAKHDLWFVLEWCFLVISVFHSHASLGSLGPTLPLAFSPALLSDIFNLPLFPFP